MEERISEERVEAHTATMARRSMMNMTNRERVEILARIYKDKKQLFFTGIACACTFLIVAIIVVIIASINNNWAIGILIMGVSVAFFLMVTASYREWKKTSDDDEKIMNYLMVELKDAAREELINDFSEIKVPASYNFHYTKVIQFIKGNYKYLLIDVENKSFVVKDGNIYTRVITFDELKDYEIFENGNSVVSGSASGALVGGLFFGVGGALAGSNINKRIYDTCSTLQLILKINDLNMPQIIITYLNNRRISKTSQEYIALRNDLQGVCAIVEYMLNHKNDKPMVVQENKVVDQLRSLKLLLDDGLITQEEYNSKKKIMLEQISKF